MNIKMLLAVFIVAAAVTTSILGGIYLYTNHIQAMAKDGYVLVPNQGSQGSHWEKTK